MAVEVAAGGDGDGGVAAAAGSSYRNCWNGYCLAIMTDLCPKTAEIRLAKEATGDRQQTTLIGRPLRMAPCNEAIAIAACSCKSILYLD